MHLPPDLHRVSDSSLAALPQLARTRRLDTANEHLLGTLSAAYCPYGGSLYRPIVCRRGFPQFARPHKRLPLGSNGMPAC